MNREDLVLELLKDIEKEKETNGVAPSYATLNGVVKAVEESLRELWRQKKIKLGDTINDKYIKIL